MTILCKEPFGLGTCVRIVVWSVLVTCAISYVVHKKEQQSFRACVKAASDVCCRAAGAIGLAARRSLLVGGTFGLLINNAGG